jgi:catechol 2,3-dioxygenase-like lactoylglutathione lyase family enzyme
MIKDVAFIAYAVRDVPKAVAFYHDVLGLQLGESFGADYVEFDVGSVTFAVDSSPPGYEPGSCSGLAFEVDDIVEARNRLIGSDSEVSDIFDFPPCRACFARDPDGNRFTLHQRKA